VLLVVGIFRTHLRKVGLPALPEQQHFTCKKVGNAVNLHKNASESSTKDRKMDFLEYSDISAEVKGAMVMIMYFMLCNLKINSVYEYDLLGDARNIDTQKS